MANAAGTTVWKWDQTEPFGNNVADENPSGLGAFDLPLRLAGQYFDKETNLHYNYYRDYDASIGRYVQSDPIGLQGGLNTYAYVGGNPLMRGDLFGLLYWNYGTDHYSTDLTTGNSYTPFPGGPTTQVPFYAGGVTSIDWWITSACVCDPNGYKFSEFTVDLFPSARTRLTYPGGQAQAEWSVRAESDHLTDLNRWQRGDGKSTAQRVEKQLKEMTFSTIEECERVTSAALQRALQGSVGLAVARSTGIHDRTGRHTYTNPSRRP